jgi:syntaxin 1B/2/3
MDRTRELHSGRAAAVRQEVSRASIDLSDETGPVTSRINKVNQLNDELEKHQANYLAHTDPKAVEKIAKTRERINAEAAEAKDRLAQMNQRTRQMMRQGISPGDATVRVRNEHFSTLTRQLRTATRTSMDAQEAHQNGVKSQLARRIKARYSNPNGSTISEGQAQEMAEQFIANGAQDQVFSQARDILDSMLRTRDEVLLLERDMRSLHQIFCDLALLVEEQSDNLAAIDKGVEQAQANIEKGAKEVSRAKKVQRSGCCVML